jgi:acyl dehydratase
MSYAVVAANHAESSENRIHSDDVAQRYGFSGALVPGVAVFGYMSHEVTRSLGASWLRHSITDLRLLKPAYAGDQLTIDIGETEEQGHRVACHNPNGVLLATLDVLQPPTMPAPDPRWRIVSDAPDPPREPIRWDVLDVHRPWRTFTWQPTVAENRDFTERVADELAVYATGLLHPHLVQHMANVVLVRRFMMPAWIHVGTVMHFRRALKAGDTIEMRTVPIDKWERKGHQFLKLYIAFVVDDTPAVEAWHTAIFRIAER